MNTITNKAQTNPMFEDDAAYMAYANSRVFAEDGKTLVSSDEKLRNKLIERNLKLVPFVIDKEYGNLAELPGIKEDLIQEGNIGLIESLAKFEPSMGFKFSTYSYFWIRQQINKFLLNNKAAPHIPCHVRIAYNKLLKEAKKNNITLKELLEDKTAVELLGITDKMKVCVKASMDTRVVVSLNDPINKHGLSGNRKSTDGVSKGNFPMVSKSTPQGTTEYGDVLESDIEPLDNTMDKLCVLNAVKNALVSLTKRERNILLLRYNIIQTAT